MRLTCLLTRFEDALANQEDGRAGEPSSGAAGELSEPCGEHLLFCGDAERAAVEGCSSQTGCGSRVMVRANPNPNPKPSNTP